MPLTMDGIRGVHVITVAYFNVLIFSDTVMIRWKICGCCWAPFWSKTLNKPKAQSWHFHYFPDDLVCLFQLNSVNARAPFSFDDIAPPSHLSFRFKVAAKQVTRGVPYYLQVYSEMFFDVSQPQLCPLITVVSRQISRHPSQWLYGGSL